MEPKDLKNSEELKRKQKADPENSEKNAADSKEEVNKKKTSETTSEEEVNSADTASEKKEAKKTPEEKEGTPAEEEKTSEDKSSEEETEKKESSDEKSGMATDEAESESKKESELEEKPDESEKKEHTPEKVADDRKESEEKEASKPDEKETVSTVEVQKDETSSAEKSSEDVEIEKEKSADEKETKVKKDEKSADEAELKTAKEAQPADKEEKVAEDKEGESKEQVSKPEEEEKEAKEKEELPSDKTSGEKDKKQDLKPESVKEHKKEKPDFSNYTQVELVNALRDVLDNNGDHDIKEDVDTIKAAFYKRLKEDLEEEKKEFLKQGGNEEEFEPAENLYERDIKDLLKRYRQIRIEFNKKLEQEKEINLEKKYQIIEEIKGLINKEESINKTFNEFRELQQEWREIGLVPQSKMKDLWETYHFHVENFYDYIKINKELRDLDLKKNLEMKIKLCEQAEELLLEPNIIKAFNALQKLHERWREIGPVPRENKDDLWERFKASTAKINKKHQEYFESRKAEQKKNLEAKRALCEQVEKINQLELNSHKEWNEKSKEVINLQKVWRTIGFAPRKDNNKIYDRFRNACDTFFDAKREFYSKNKELQLNNLQMKIDLCVQAESLKESTDWKKTTQDYINIQKQWKEIGPVPRKQSDAIWKRFRAACDYFFDKKSEHFATIDSEQNENLKKKEQLVKDIQNFKSSGNVNENLKVLKEFQRRWTEIGHVPIKKKDDIQKRFREAINKLYDDLNLDETKRNLLKFRTKMSSFSESSRGQNKMRFERDKYMNKLKQLENDLVLLDNNIGFFAKSENAESLIEDVNKKIEQTKEKIEFLKDKIRIIDEMDQTDD